MNDEISPEIAALLEQTEKSLPSKPAVQSFADTNESPETQSQEPAIMANVDLNVRQFAPIEKFFLDEPNPIFKDGSYYNTALSGENDTSKRLHEVLKKYLTAKEPKERTVYRQQLIVIYWEFIKSIAPKMALSNPPEPKKMLIRFAAVLPSLLSEEMRELFGKAIPDNKTGEPVYYVDEWFHEIATGKITPSATDEARPVKKAGPAGNVSNSQEQSRLLALQSKNNGKLQSAENLLNAKESERKFAETELCQKVNQLCEHRPYMDLETHLSTYDELQKHLFREINDKLKILMRIDKELTSYKSDYMEAKEIADSLNQKISSQGSEVTEVDESSLTTEIGTIRQMAKMTCGRQGNHYPILTREYFHCPPRGVGFRENVINMLSEVEKIDPGAFCRVHKNQSNRIVPYVILVPTYGDSGFCWEPFDKYNRNTSRGRIVIPMYPKNLQLAVLTAIADLRWLVAKEKASFHWMEEGLTGQYYQWFDQQKLKGDVKDYFINDYVLWITKESEGVQRLEKEVRAVFWRHVPFPQELKDKLKTRSPIYQELYQRDINRSMSDGY